MHSHAAVSCGTNVHSGIHFLSIASCHIMESHSLKTWKGIMGVVPLAASANMHMASQWWKDLAHSSTTPWKKMTKFSFFARKYMACCHFLLRWWFRLECIQFWYRHWILTVVQGGQKCLEGPLVPWQYITIPGLVLGNFCWLATVAKIYLFF